MDSMKRILITNELSEWLSNKPILNEVTQSEYMLIVRDLSKFPIEDGMNILNNKYVAVINNGYGYPFDCSEKQVDQMVEWIIEDIESMKSDNPKNYEKYT